MRYYQDEKNALIGSTLKSVEKTGQASVLFTTDKGTVTLELEGECCSDAYIYDIVGDLTGKIITKVESDDREDQPGEQTVIDRIKAIFSDKDKYLQEFRSIWSVTIYAGDRKLRIMHCNASNGYYDSFCNWSVTP